ncbi:MAG: hypothetical protein CME71_04660 [Halobacteriovorax sp.]|nr:hypothetical protein [Halobacteriovorax sp.]|tara:strand:+ start:960 stop:2465 length:1506 start_codon:yes stop_codon:yes gene_type:complete
MNSNKFSIYDNLFAPLVVVDKDYKVTYFNQAFLVLTQSSPRSLKNLDRFSLIFNESEVIERFLKGSVQTSEELTLTTPSGHGPLTLVLKSFSVDNDLVITFNDLTVERTLYSKYRVQLEEIKRTHEKILQTDKLATLGELSAGISHEINNPLTIAYGYAQTIEFEVGSKDVIKCDELKTSIERVTSSLEKISSIINNMKSYVRTDEEHKEYCDLKDIATAAIELTHTGLIKETIKLNLKAPKDPLLVQCNRVELEQVIVNLLKNSFDSLLDAKTAAPLVSISLSRGENNISVTVSDNGPGISDQHKEMIFQPFFTTKDIGKGSGLGLSISRRLIEKHQGHLELIDSENGAVLKFDLPTMEMSSMLTSGGFGPEIGPVGQKKVLIVDDEPIVLNQLDELLRGAGYSVVSSTGGEDALNLLIQTEIDLVITDLFMPRMSGSDLSSKVRMLEEDIPIIYLSGAPNAQEIFEKDKKNLVIHSLISKPFSEETLLSTLAQALKVKP